MSVRVIARLDVKSENLIKGIRFEGLKRIGDPAEAAARYFVEGADEVYLVDTVASLYGRNHMGPLLEKVAKKVFVPLTASGGIRTVHDAELLFGFGADKVGLNTSTFENQVLIPGIAEKYGSQSVVGSIHAKRINDGWECLVEQGRERTGVNLEKRIQQLIAMGVGEILVTSVDNDGVQGGFDTELAQVAESVCTVPLVLGGGCGSMAHVTDVLKQANLSGVALGSSLHYGKFTIGELKNEINKTSKLSEEITNA
jgi:cyclase